MRFLLWATLGFLLASCGGGDTPHATLSPQSAEINATSFLGARGAYTVTRSGTGWTVVEKASGLQTAVSATAQSLVFSDVTLNLQVEAKAASIAASDLKLLVELYIAFFNRAPDADGLAFWIDQFKGGRSIDSIADAFYAAAVQYSSLTGYSAQMSNADFVKIIYRNVLGRSGATAPPDADVAFWAGELASGAATRGSLIRVMLGSAHTFKGDATWGWVADLLDNKWRVGQNFAVTQGLTFNSPSDSITQGMAIAAAVTPTDFKSAERIAQSVVDPTSWKVTIPTSRTLIPTLTYDIPPNPYMLSFETAWQIPRGIDFLDMNGDDRPDMLLTPGYGQHLPVLPLQVWLNNGDGTFRNGTTEVFDGPPPLVWSPSQVLVRDFNGDGRPDVFFVDTGPELASTGYHNSLILSQPNGKYVDATANIPVNGIGFNHMGGAADANGDGNVDVVWNVFPALGDPVLARGMKLIFGDGKGGFTDETSRLPMEIRWMTDNDRIALGGSAVLNDFHNAGCAALADLDGDGKAEVVSGSYLNDAFNGDRPRTIRVQKLGSDGKFKEAARMTIPQAIASVPFDPGNPNYANRGLGCSQIMAGDFHGTGRNDLLVQWEGNGQWYVELLRNDGNFQFTDVTLEAFGHYNDGFMQPYAMGPGHYRVTDINNDGKPDIVSQLGGTTLGNIVNNVAWINDGAGRFRRWAAQGPNGPISSSDLLAAAKCQGCAYIPLMVDTTGSGIASLVLMDFQSLKSSGTPQQTTGVYLTVFEPAGWR